MTSSRTPASPCENAPGRLVAFVDWALRHRGLLLLLCLVSGALAVGPSRRLDFDRGIEGLFAESDPRLANYREAKRLFGGSESAVMAYTDPQLLTADGLKRVEVLDAQLRALAGVRQVLSLGSARLPGSPLSAKTMREQLESKVITPAQMREEVLACDLYNGNLVSPDGQTTVLLISLAPVGQADTKRAETFAKIRQIGEQHRPAAMLAGETVLVEEVYRHLEMDGQTLGIASSLVLALVIGVLFRNLRWIVLPLAVVHLTLVWTKATLVISGLRLSMVSSPLVALVTVIGVATVVHITLRFHEERQAGHPAPDALRRTMVYIGPAIFWTCLTTALGFSSLLASRIVPVGGFGIMMSLGALLVFVATAALIPGGVLLGRYGTDPARPLGEERLTAILDRIADVIRRNPRRVMLIGLGSVLLAAGGAFRLQVATDFNENFRKSSSVVKSYEFLSNRMGTTAMFELLIDAPDPNDYEAFDEFLEKLRILQSELTGEHNVVGTLSLGDVLDFVMGTRKERAPPVEWATAKVLENLRPSQRLQLLQRMQPDTLAGFWNREQNVVRVIVQTSRTEGAVAKRQLIENIERRARAHFPSTRAAGVFILLTYVVQNLLADQWITFALALTAILLVISVAFRSWRLGLIALAPNAAPILIVVGVMGWTGLKINMATAMLASVSIGLSVDFSIHYLYRFRQEQRLGKSIDESLRAAHSSVGLAMLLANVALIAGFSTLTLSQFIPTVHFGILVSVAMLGGLIGNLTVLPLLLQRCLPAERR